MVKLLEYCQSLKRVVILSLYQSNKDYNNLETLYTPIEVFLLWCKRASHLEYYLIILGIQLHSWPSKFAVEEDPSPSVCLLDKAAVLVLATSNRPTTHHNFDITNATYAPSSGQPNILTSTEWIPHHRHRLSL